MYHDSSPKRQHFCVGPVPLPSSLFWSRILNEMADFLNNETTLLLIILSSHFFFHFHFCLFFCTQYSKYLYLRQLRYGAGGFSYKSMWTSQELFPLLILNCKFSSCTKKREQINTIRCEFGSKAHKRGIPFAVIIAH